MPNADTTTTARQHKARELHTWVIAHADNLFTIEDAMKGVNWNSSATGAALRRMMDAYPEQMESRSRGVYKWHSKPMPNQLKTGAYSRGDDLLVTVAATKPDGTMLVTDSTTGDLFAMKPVDF